MMLISVQSYKLAPLKRQHYANWRRFWWCHRGRFVTSHICCVDTPQSSQFLFFPVSHVGQRQKLLSSRPTPSQSDASLTVAAGGREGAPRWGASLCCHRENVKIAEVQSITSYFGHEDLVKTKLFIKVHEKNKGKAFYYNKKKLKYLNSKKS
jgi:hypothetical protein